MPSFSFDSPPTFKRAAIDLYPYAPGSDRASPPFSVITNIGRSPAFFFTTPFLIFPHARLPNGQMISSHTVLPQALVAQMRPFLAWVFLRGADIK